MPQIAKGGKFIFGWSIISSEGCVKIPEMTFNEYNLSIEQNVILISGSKISGGFCVSNYSLMKSSIMNGLFLEYPEIREYSIREGNCIKFKGRLYCWVKLQSDGIIKLTDYTMESFNIKPGNKLLSIRGSNIAFVLAAKGPLIEAANNYKGSIDEFIC
ncbi:MAG: hypothetical protein GX639_04425 [Fibrobacter sp.]|nr:hypothetical protein [Fibrobacter sp.]